MYTLSTVGENVIFKFDKYENVIAINAFTDDLSEGADIKKEFAYSRDGSIYSDWTLITDITFSEFVIDPLLPFYIKFKYTLVSGSATVSKVTLGFTKGSTATSTNTAPFLSASIQANFSNPYGIQFNPNPTLNFYKQGKAQDLHNKLSESTFNMFGHDSWYYRAMPRRYGTDAFLHEHSKLYTDVRKCFKIMIPENEFNQTTPAFDPFGVQFSDQLPFEVEVNKTMFEKLYGKGQMPQKDDVIFIPILNMIYEVQSSFLFREFMNEGVFYKVALKKYQPSSSRDETINIIDEIEDNLGVDVVSADKLFGTELEEDAKRIIDKQQTDLKTVSVDPVRLSLDNDMSINTDDIISSYNVTISDTYYDMSSVHDPALAGERIAVQYKGEFDTVNNDAHTFLSWVKATDVSGKDATVTSFVQGGNGTYTVTLNRNFNVLGIDSGYEIQIENTTKGIFFVGIVDNVSGNTARLTLDDQMLAALIEQSPTWSAGSKTLRRASNMALMKSANFTLELVTANMLRMKIGAVSKLIGITDIGTSWTGIAVAISNEFKQLSVSTWQTGSLYTEGNVINIDKIIIEDFEYDATITASNFYIPTSFAKITNLRVFTEYVNYDNIEIMMAKYVIENAHHAIVIDNAIEQLTQRFIGKAYPYLAGDAEVIEPIGSIFDDTFDDTFN
jgi:hypothetical protein